jgi:hypothetical protein
LRTRITAGVPFVVPGGVELRLFGNGLLQRTRWIEKEPRAVVSRGFPNHRYTCSTLIRRGCVAQVKQFDWRNFVNLPCFWGNFKKTKALWKGATD